MQGIVVKSSVLHITYNFTRIIVVKGQYGYETTSN